MTQPIAIALTTPAQDDLFAHLPQGAGDYTPEQRAAVIDYLIALPIQDLRRYQSVVIAQVQMAATAYAEASDSLLRIRAEANLGDMQAREAYVYDALWFHTTGVRRD